MDFDTIQFKNIKFHGLNIIHLIFNKIEGLTITDNDAKNLRSCTSITLTKAQTI